MESDFLWIFVSLIFLTSADRFNQRTCQEITIPMCKGIGYNMTYMPNQFNHDNQEEAGLEVHQFWPLVEIKCSPDLQFFLCSMYTPICVTNYHKPLPACRSVCERAKAGCSPLMRQYGFAWPERMSCERLPEFGDKDNLCMDFNTSTTTTTPTPKPVAPIKPIKPVKPAQEGEYRPEDLTVTPRGEVYFFSVQILTIYLFWYILVTRLDLSLIIDLGQFNEADIC